jgi:hypothetical protein
MFLVMFNQKRVHCQIFRKRQIKKEEEVLTLVFSAIAETSTAHSLCVAEGINKNEKVIHHPKMAIKITRG